jgi:outer membrane protein FlgP
MLVVVSVFLAMSSPAWSHKNESPTEDGRVKKEPVEIIEPIVVRVTGYGAYASKEDALSEPKRLMAIRSSKLDAYRAMAERLYGIGISGKSSVDEFVLKSDGLAAALDSFVRGARVVSIIENKDRGFETVLEVLLPGNFNECVNKVNHFKYGADCLRPLPSLLGGTAASDSAYAKRPRQQPMQNMYHLK